MSTITKDVTTEHHDRRFEDRLLDALLVEFDAPSEVRESAGVTPARRPRRSRRCSHRCGAGNMPSMLRRASVWFASFPGSS